VALIAVAATAGCGPDQHASTPAVSKTAPAAPAMQQRANPLFVDATASSGIDFRHINGRTGEFYYPEIIGSGVAVLDYNNDGRLDILVLQGGRLAPAPEAKSATTSSAAADECTGRLYRNDLVVGADGARKLHFTDVTASSGLCSRGYGMGIAVGDYNNDGCVDVFITHFGAPNQLFRNNCDGTFTDVTRQAGVAGSGRWGASASFVDYDRDGRLDLFVANYVDYTVQNNQKCYASTSARDYCAPSAYKPAPGILYRNRGNGTFEDVSIKSGITRAYGAGLGVMAADLNEDGWPDLYVANDGNPNQLWINQKDGTFRNEAEARGCAVNADGMAEAGMGVDIADFDGDGNEDIFLTHLTREKSTLFVNRGSGYFEDRSVETGVAAPSIPFTGFGTAFLDYDNDGWLDIVAVNGAVRLIQELKTPQNPYPLEQRKQLLRNLGNGRFEETTAAAGEVFKLEEVGRGLAVGDLDNDGASDLVVSNNNGPLRVILNHAGGGRPWMGLRLLSGKRDAYGARVEIRRKGAPPLWRRVHADGSYLSSGDPRILLGLGTAPDVEAAIERVIVHWPDGSTETFPVPPLRQYTTLVQGTGHAGAAN
jgi:enediyne biosynthesis protein E4